MQRLRQFLGVGFFRIIKLDCAECLTKGLDRCSVAINLFFQPFFRGCAEPAFLIRFVVEESDRAECSVCLRAFKECFEFMQIRGFVFQIQNMCRDFVDETVFFKAFAFGEFAAEAAERSAAVGDIGKNRTRADRRKLMLISEHDRLSCVRIDDAKETVRQMFVHHGTFVDNQNPRFQRIGPGRPFSVGKRCSEQFMNRQTLNSFFIGGFFDQRIEIGALLRGVNDGFIQAAFSLSGRSAECDRRFGAILKRDLQKAND